MKKTKKAPVTKGKTVYVVYTYYANHLEVCSTRDAADRFIASVCQRYDFLAPHMFSTYTKRVK